MDQAQDQNPSATATPSFTSDQQFLTEFWRHVSREQREIQAMFQSRLEAQATAMRDLAQAVQRPMPRVRYPAPTEKFSGKERHESKLIAFLREASMYLDANGIKDMEDRLLHFQGLLTPDGPAKLWVLPLFEQLQQASRSPDPAERNSLPAHLQDWQVFSKRFMDHFHNPQDRARAREQFNRISQRTTTRDYTLHFNELRARLGDVPESAAMDTYFSGLKDHLKPYLSLNRPDNLSDLQEAAHTLDDATSGNRTRNLTYASPHYPTTERPAWTSALPQGGGSQVIPMDVDTIKTPTRKGPLSQEERERRFKNNLCMYCGNPGHRAVQCPRAPPRVTSVAGTNVFLDAQEVTGTN